jgi:hypothetical protein
MLLMHVIISYPFLFSHPRSYLAGVPLQVDSQLAVRSRAYLSLQRVYSYPTLLTTLALNRSSTSDGGAIKVFFRAILRPFILAAFVLPSGDGTAYPQVVCRAALSGMPG